MKQPEDERQIVFRFAGDAKPLLRTNNAKRGNEKYINEDVAKKLSQ